MGGRGVQGSSRVQDVAQSLEVKDTCSEIREAIKDSFSGFELLHHTLRPPPPSLLLPQTMILAPFPSSYL